MTSNNRLKKLWANLANKAYRQAFVSENVISGVAVQIQENRSAREMTQGELAKSLGVTQGRVSRLENPSGSPTLNTLVRIANAFDCGLLVRFVPFSEMARWAISVQNEAAAVSPFPLDSLDERPTTTAIDYAALAQETTAGVASFNTGAPEAPIWRLKAMRVRIHNEGTQDETSFVPELVN